MGLTSSLWLARQSFYDSLNLRKDGDDAEQLGCVQYDLDKSFAEYEKFWRYHVAPATQRPMSALLFNAGVHAAVIELAQRSYTVFAYLLEANEYLAQLRAGNIGPRFRKWYNTIMYAGNALQVFTGVQETIEQSLAAAMRQTLKLFPDWPTAWNPGRESVVNYRNYVTHQGKFQFFEEGGTVFVLKRTEVTRATGSWWYSVTDFKSQRVKWASVADVAADTVKETTDWLNRAYARINATLSDLPPLLAYQTLWGWRASGYIGTALPVMPSQGFGAVIPHVGLSGVRTVPNPNMCATTSPPPDKSPPIHF